MINYVKLESIFDINQEVNSESYAVCSQYSFYPPPDVMKPTAVNSAKRGANSIDFCPTQHLKQLSPNFMTFCVFVHRRSGFDTDTLIFSSFRKAH